MKFLIALLLTAFLGYVAPLYTFMPWWSFAATSFLIAVAIHQRGFKAFLSGFLGMFLLWGTYSFILDQNNNSILSGKIARLFSLGDNGLTIILLGALLAGLVSGFAALAGSYLRSVGGVRKRKKVQTRSTLVSDEAHI